MLSENELAPQHWGSGADHQGSAGQAWELGGLGGLGEGGQGYRRPEHIGCTLLEMVTIWGEVRGVGGLVSELGLCKQVKHATKIVPAALHTHKLL